MEIASLFVSILTLIVNIIMLFKISKIVNFSSDASGRDSKIAATNIKGNSNSTSTVQ